LERLFPGGVAASAPALPSLDAILGPEDGQVGDAAAFGSSATTPSASAEGDSGCTLNTRDLNDALLRCGDVAVAEAAVAAARAQGATLTGHTYRAVALCASRSGRWDAALGALQAAVAAAPALHRAGMSAADIGLSPAFEGALAACCRARNLAAAERVVRAMRAARVEHTPPVVEQVLRCFELRAAEGEPAALRRTAWYEACEYFVAVRRLGVAGTARGYNSLTRLARGSNANARLPLAIMDAMREDGVPEDASTTVGLIDAWSNRRSTNLNRFRS
jgi:hypothetical protein